VVSDLGVLGNGIAGPPGSAVNFAQVYNSLTGAFTVTGTNAACAAGVVCVGTVTLNNSATRIADNAVHALFVTGQGAKARAESAGAGTVARP
jgi:hypothetical protein